MAANKVTAEHAKEFFRYVCAWQTLLGLTDWRFEMSTKRTKNMAEVAIFSDIPLASFHIGRSFGEVEVTPQTLEYFALHEVLHVFLYTAVTTPSDIDEHRVINVLVKRLLEAKT